MDPAVFVILSICIIASALAVVTMRNIFHCALALIFCLFCIAGLYVMLNAEFLAVVQVLLYVGAVAILMIFAIMLTSRLAGHEKDISNEQQLVGGFLSLVFLVAMVGSYLGVPGVCEGTYFRPATGALPVDNTHSIGTLLMTDFVLPFELVSVLLLAALIGAIVIARREEG